jgi:hypothetical protein
VQPRCILHATRPVDTLRRRRKKEETEDVSRFIAEVYVPIAGNLPGITKKVGSAAERLIREGTPIQHLRSIHVPEDEMCLLLFEATDPASVHEATRRAGLAVARVVAAIEEAAPTRRGRDSR